MDKGATMSKRFYAVLPNFIGPLAGMSTDIYLPSLPHLAKQFHATNAHVQLTITAYVLAMGIAQFIAGPLSDSYGRKKMIIGALIVQLLSVVMIILSTSISVFIMARFIQGLACGFMIVPGRAILNDCFEGQELKKKFNTLTISFALAPIIAPFIGGYCQEYMGWQASFYFILIYTVILFFVCLSRLDETIKHKTLFSWHKVRHNYWTLITTRQYCLSVILLSVMFGYSSLLSVLGPFIFQSHFHLSAVLYGYVALSFGFAWFLGNISNHLLFDVSLKVKARFSLFTQLLMIGFLFVIVSSHNPGMWFILIPCLMIIFCAALIFPIFVGESLSMVPTLAASSNALLFSSTWLAFSVYSVLATQLSASNLLPMVIVFLLVNLSCHTLYYLVKKNP
jgi:Bcr/CflA subfamily drug resistance transporter